MTMTSKRIILLAVIIAVAFVLGRLAVREVLNLLLGGTLGTLAGLGLGLSPRVSRALMPLMTGLNGLPKLALGPLFIIWFGMGLSSKVLISALMVFFIFAFKSM